MMLTDMAKPATAPHGEPALSFERIAGPLSNSHTPNIITAQLVGGDIAIVDDIEARGPLDLCRRLIAAGVNPGAELHCYRGGQLALRITSIRYGAGIVVRETATEGPRFATWRPFPTARSDRPFDKNRTGYIGSPGSLENAYKKLTKRGGIYSADGDEDDRQPVVPQ
jgi:hypothetical protein